MKKIPELFQQRMKSMLQKEYHAFIQTYEASSHQGLRVNTLKIEASTFLPLSPFSLEPVPWCPTGYYYSDQYRPGKHPYHAAGLYYIQEPSAMSVVEWLEPQPGERILDLCAAPGGKSTQIAAFLQGQGLLITNEINHSRAKALSENIERCGVKNALVTNETPDRLADRFPAFFDRILVDAPCSGEGMFRKLEEACDDWSNDKVMFCANMQEEILDCAAHMLKPGGIIVYSTCTFSPEENEGKMAQFLSKHPEFELEDLHHQHGISSGCPDWGEGREDLHKTARLWPHRLKGEGHFAAKLRKIDGDEAEETIFTVRERKSKVDKPSLQLFDEFQKEFLTLEQLLNDNSFLLFGDQLYAAPQGMPNIDKLKVVRPGWHLGTVKKGRFEPSHSLSLGLKQNEVKQYLTFRSDQPEIERYLKGESLMVEGTMKGWTLICVDDYPLGWGKVSNGQCKNHYPKGLRWV